VTTFDFQLKALKPLYTILVVALIFKLILSAVLPLTSDEAYYWMWSHHMQLSFFDHPPAVAWLFWLAQPIENFGSASRWPGVLLSHGTLILWLLILKPVMTEGQLRLWLWLALLSPLIGAGSLIITPDTPLLFCWALTLLMFLRWIQQPTFSRALWLGLSCGLGFCSKYVMVLEPMFLLFASLMISEWRTAMKKGWWVILLGVFLGSTPVWVWNYLHDFVSIRFQADHGLGQKLWKPNWTYEYILVQIGLIFPTVVIWAAKSTKRAPGWLSLLAWGPLAFFALTSFKGYVEANWPIVAYAEIFALAVLALPQPTVGYRVTIGIWTTALVAMMFLIVTRWSPTGHPIKTREFFEFEPLRAAVLQHQPMYARSYQMASQLSFELKKPVYKLHGMNRRDFYDFLSESQPTGDRFYVMAEKEDLLPPNYEASGFRIVARIPVPEDTSNTYEVWSVSKMGTPSP